MVRKILNIVGARPNFMKMAPIIKAISAILPSCQQYLVHTGQHYDEKMSKVFFMELGLPEPDLYLGVGSGSHAQQTAKIMLAIEPVILDYQPDLIIVVGDVNSTLACSLVAAKLGVKIAHVEAGLRSFDNSMPEEVNRILTDRISDLLFVSEESGLANLRAEGCQREKIHFVGNVMIDTLLKFRKEAGRSDILGKLGVDDADYLLLTLHRPSNVDELETFGKILSALREVSQKLPIFFPVHPRTRSKIADFGFSDYFSESNGPQATYDDGGIFLMEPLGYLDFIKMASMAKIVLTDSGGIQEETTILNVPCLTLRRNTERPATITHGTNELVGTDPDKILSSCLKILNGGGKTGETPKYWDGIAAERIAKIICDYWGNS